VIASRVFSAVDSHTEGMPTRVITGGVGPIPGETMLARKLHFEQHMDELRLLLMREPRGHGAMSGAILQPPLRPDADWGVVFIEVSGCLPMCGHGAIGVATFANFLDNCCDVAGCLAIVAGNGGADEF